MTVDEALVQLKKSIDQQWHDITAEAYDDAYKAASEEVGADLDYWKAKSYDYACCALVMTVAAAAMALGWGWTVLR